MNCNTQKRLLGAVILCIGLFTYSCSNPEEEKAIALYNTHCASCHLPPAIDDLPKHIWKNGVLPDMAARMGIIDSTNAPYEGLSFDEQYAIKQTGIYPSRPLLSLKDWHLLENYIIDLAPDSLPSNAASHTHNELTQFASNPIPIDSANSALTTFLAIDEQQFSLISADLNGHVQRHNFISGETESLMQTGEAVTDYYDENGHQFVTHTGYLNPSEIASGNIQIKANDTLVRLRDTLHRPVHTLVHDLNADGRDELVVSEFGNLTGALSLFVKNPDQTYRKRILLNRPGATRAIAKDMNADGKDDLIVLTAQGKESIVIFYQNNNLEFTGTPVIEFSPVYGTSWFELIDYDGDGDDDIITVNGDNADKSYVHKPYHGLRIHINNGENKFEEKYFYAMNGATRFVARDFDKDGDVDFGILSTFPDYEKKPEFSFVYLENKNTTDFTFEQSTFRDSNMGRWLLMDAGDVDGDGDEDIILSSFTYVFTPVPKAVSKFWKESNVDIMFLENKLLDKNQSGRFILH